MKKGFSKYLTILIILSVTTLVLVSSRKVGNTNTSNLVEISNINSDLDTSQTKDNLSPVQAEQTGSSPESGATSRLKQVHDWLVAKSDPDYGGAQPADWSFDFGTYWNRILYSAFWEPDGTATESDVLEGKTFYSGSNNRVQKTGTLTPATSPGAYDQQFDQYVDAHASDYQGEESTWVKSNTSSGSQVWHDTRTGLYWSYNLGFLTNNFSSPSTGVCDFFNTGTYPTRGSYGTSGTYPACGNAINACAVLSLASIEGQSANTDWYLPSQKELQQAYINGIYNQTDSSINATNSFWSSTENSSISTKAWSIRLDSGNFSDAGTKTNNGLVICVRRD